MTKFKKSYASTASTIIKGAYGSSRNLMTPDVIRRGKLSRNVAYELSEGSDFDGGRMFGVTIARLTPEGKYVRTELSHSFFNRDDAETYINRVKSVNEAGIVREADTFLSFLAFMRKRDMPDAKERALAESPRGKELVKRVSKTVEAFNKSVEAFNKSQSRPATMTVEHRPKRKRLDA